jgi:predicted phosphoribosyltransferase
MRAIAHPSLIGLLSPTDVVAPFADRADAGAGVADRLAAYRNRHALVLGVPRGGVPVAAVVARALDAELDIVVARKLGAPISAELAIGAVTADGGRYLNDAMIRELGIPASYVDAATKREMAEAARRESRFRGDAPPGELAGRTVILVDDGLATGATMIAAARSVRGRAPGRLVVAVPVGSAQACAQLRREADEVVCLSAPEPFWAVGIYYRDFGQTEDEEVERLLRESKEPRPTVTRSAAAR